MRHLLKKRKYLAILCVISIIMLLSTSVIAETGSDSEKVSFFVKIIRWLSNTGRSFEEPPPVDPVDNTPPADNAADSNPDDTSCCVSEDCPLGYGCNLGDLDESSCNLVPGGNWGYCDGTFSCSNINDKEDCNEQETCNWAQPSCGCISSDILMTGDSWTEEGCINTCGANNYFFADAYCTEVDYWYDPDDEDGNDGSNDGNDGNDGSDDGTDPDDDENEDSCNNNDAKEEGEECDGPDLDLKTCSDFGNYNAGSLTCTDQCKFDSSDCRYKICDPSNPNSPLNSDDPDESLCNPLAVGVCAGLKKECIPIDGNDYSKGGVWKTCTEEDYPDLVATEKTTDEMPDICNDGKDNDCDGTTDGEDPSCHCGNGVIESQYGEECEGNNLNNKTCSNYKSNSNYNFGDLQCNDQCKFRDTSCIVCSIDGSNEGALNRPSCPKQKGVCENSKAPCILEGEDTSWGQCTEETYKSHSSRYAEREDDIENGCQDGPDNDCDGDQDNLDSDCKYSIYTCEKACQLEVEKIDESLTAVIKPKDSDETVEGTNVQYIGITKDNLNSFQDVRCWCYSDYDCGDSCEEKDWKSSTDEKPLPSDDKMRSELENSGSLKKIATWYDGSDEKECYCYDTCKDTCNLNDYDVPVRTSAYDPFDQVKALVEMYYGSSYNIVYYCPTLESPSEVNRCWCGTDKLGEKCAKFDIPDKQRDCKVCEAKLLDMKWGYYWEPKSSDHVDPCWYCRRILNHAVDHKMYANVPSRIGEKCEIELDEDLTDEGACDGQGRCDATLTPGNKVYLVRGVCTLFDKGKEPFVIASGMVSVYQGNYAGLISSLFWDVDVGEAPNGELRLRMYVQVPFTKYKEWIDGGGSDVLTCSSSGCSSIGCEVK
ncbi:MAG: hypothetical protein KKC75_05465 [Nanoarchaeota archaeon]|nr:hypothetical protein [Nanoarchaeota archaeon]MBU1945897.1 hypothetical protein [Nanoarchaeota archaeon]